MVNDFEDILGKILSGENSEIVELFKNIINDFLLNEPHVITEDLEDEWGGMGVSERLNYKSPIPLNPEQLKILRALKNEKCKYIVVSYNNTYKSKSSSSKNKITLDAIKKILNKKGFTKRFFRKHKHFNSGKTNFKDHKEFLFVTKVLN